MNERERADRLAEALARQLSGQNPSDPAGPEEGDLLQLAARLSTDSPFAPTEKETAWLRRRFEQAREAAVRESALSRGWVKPVTRAVVIAVLLVVVFAGMSLLIKDVLRVPGGSVAAPLFSAATPSAGTETPAATPPAPAETPVSGVFPFPVQSHTVKGVRLELRDLKSIGSSFKATLCYQPPDGRAWRLEEVSLQTVDANGVFYPSSSAQPAPGEDGLACETFTAAIPKGGKVGSIDIAVKRLVAQRETTPDCVQLNRQLAEDYPGLAIRCDSTGGAFGWTVEKTPNGMTAGKIHRLEQTYLDYDVRSGPWNFTVSPVQVAPMADAGYPADLVVVPAACADASRLAADPQFSNSLFFDTPAGVAGLSSLQSGDFTFTLALACDPSFSRLKVTGDDNSEINGLGVVYAIAYEGSETIEKVEYFNGVSPFIIGGGDGGSMRRGDRMSGWEGLRFPENARPDFAQSDVTLRYQVKVRTGEGKIEGAALVFTLQRASDGFRPVNVEVAPLTAAEQQTVESDLFAPVPYPVLPAATQPVSMETQALLDLLDGWQRPLLSAPGWVHLGTRTEMPAGNDLYAGLTVYRTDEWYQIDAQGMVTTLIHVDSRLDGAPLQQAISQNGRTTNLTYGMGGDFKPYPLDLAYAVKGALKDGAKVQQGETVIAGRRVILLEAPGIVTQREAIDAASGAWLYSETGERRAGDRGDGFYLKTRITLEAAERVDAPPPEVQALLGKEFTGYTPPAPYGTPAPQGFDPAKSRLAMHLVPGDRFDAPSFWYGDITADGYLLGRVNFGSAAGSSCVRSSDGSRLAFNFMVSDAAGSVVSQSLRWLDVRSIQNVQTAAPEITNIGTLTWSPKEEKLAFFGCQENQTNCALYRFDPASGKVDRLVPDVYSGWPVIWKPDGSQLAFVNTLDQQNAFIVIDFSAGQMVYQGLFNADAWQVPDDSPAHQWGVSFPRGSSGNACFEVK